MKRPTQVLLKIIKLGDAESFQAGRMAMALELITVIKTLEDHPIMDFTETRAVVNVLRTLIVDQDLTSAYEVYDRLDELRKPVFVPVSDAEALQSGDSSSQGASPASAPSRIRRIRSLLAARQSQDDEASDELWGLIDEATEETPTA
jgi:hypothetical protein